MSDPPRIGMLCSRLRVEEKFLRDALTHRGVKVDVVDDRELTLPLARTVRRWDAVLERSLSQTRGLALLRVFESWGVPTIKIHCAFGDNEKALLRDMSIQAAEMLAAAGAREIRPYVEDNPPGLTIHEMGTARMGRDPKTSVLNAHNQAHEVKNLFMTDGACMTSSSCVNPSLTYMALTARACDYAVSQMKKGEL